MGGREEGRKEGRKEGHKKIVWLPIFTMHFYTALLAVIFIVQIYYIK